MYETTARKVMKELSGGTAQGSVLRPEIWMILYHAQFLTGHGQFSAYLHRMGIRKDPYCSALTVGNGRALDADNEGQLDGNDWVRKGGLADKEERGGYADGGVAAEAA
ncbi:hypothetical protein KQX54_011991 [Cotesia glomerata]|uniref:Uncharacterized protein n=1 Tax=Cotesia glomerata TaxID=32391 RepID=A0AAV7HXR2_COTGL|nr:hypothetical protein KQX54_011991 [Cotesia glomerata]